MLSPPPPPVCLVSCSKGLLISVASFLVSVVVAAVVAAGVAAAVTAVVAAVGAAGSYTRQGCRRRG